MDLFKPDRLFVLLMFKFYVCIFMRRELAMKITAAVYCRSNEMDF
jgi:hypothetical protein